MQLTIVSSIERIRRHVRLTGILDVLFELIAPQLFLLNYLLGLTVDSIVSLQLFLQLYNLFVPLIKP